VSRFGTEGRRLAAMTLPQLIAQHDKLGAIGEELRTRTVGMEGFSSDPNMVAATVFMRAWSHMTAFSTLWRAGHNLECEIILRCTVETAICMANLQCRPTEFIEELREDSAHTMRGQIKMMQKHKFDFVDEVAAGTNDIFGNVKGKGLNWSDLADKAYVGDLYTYHKAISATAAHVTGISLLRAIDRGVDEPESQVDARERIMGWMCASLLTIFLTYARIQSFDDLILRTAMVANEMMTLAGIPDAF